MAFEVEINKIKNLYTIKNDGTSIDDLVIELSENLEEILFAISVKGLKAGKNEFYFRDNNNYSFNLTSLYWESEEPSIGTYRKYYIKLFLDERKLPLRICNMDYVEGYDDSLKPGSEVDYKYNTQFAYSLLKDTLTKKTRYFEISTFYGYVLSSEWSKRAFIKLIVDLKVDENDLFIHLGQSNLTDCGRAYFDEIKTKFKTYIRRHSLDLIELFQNKSRVLEITRIAENSVRRSHNIRPVGEAYVNEALLSELIEEYFPDAIRQYRSKWLGNYIIDIFIPSIKIAIEYQGEQHYMPIERYGGEDKLEKQKIRDDNVRLKCKRNGVKLYEWPYYLEVNSENVRKFIKENI